jgi:hypothetical protein
VEAEDLASDDKCCLYLYCPYVKIRNRGRTLVLVAEIATSDDMPKNHWLIYLSSVHK